VLKSREIALRLLNAFAGYTHGNAWERSEFSYCLAPTFVGTVPFTTAQERTDELPSALVAMDTITPMDGYSELTIPPAFVNEIGDRLRHASPSLPSKRESAEGISAIGCACRIGGYQDQHVQ
jgi:hypothetical protein